MTKVDMETLGQSKVALIYGQMTEPPGARLRVALSGLTVAEYFRDKGLDVLLFIDNIFRFTQAGSEVSALLGPHAFSRGLSTKPRIGNGRDAGTDHVNQNRIDYFDPGGLCSRG